MDATLGLPLSLSLSLSYPSPSRDNQCVSHVNNASRSSPAATEANPPRSPVVTSHQPSLSPGSPSLPLSVAPSSPVPSSPLQSQPSSTRQIFPSDSQQPPRKLSESTIPAQPVPLTDSASTAAQSSSGSDLSAHNELEHRRAVPSLNSEPGDASYEYQFAPASLLCSQSHSSPSSEAFPVVVTDSIQSRTVSTVNAMPAPINRRAMSTDTEIYSEGDIERGKPNSNFNFSRNNSCIHNPLINLPNTNKDILQLQLSMVPEHSEPNTNSSQSKAEGTPLDTDSTHVSQSVVCNAAQECNLPSLLADCTPSFIIPSPPRPSPSHEPVFFSPRTQISRTPPSRLSSFHQSPVQSLPDPSYLHSHHASHLAAQSTVPPNSLQMLAALHSTSDVLPSLSSQPAISHHPTQQPVQQQSPPSHSLVRTPIRKRSPCVESSLQLNAHLFSPPSSQRSMPPLEPGTQHPLFKSPPSVQQPSIHNPSSPSLGTVTHHEVIEIDGSDEQKPLSPCQHPPRTPSLSPPSLSHQFELPSLPSHRTSIPSEPSQPIAPAVSAIYTRSHSLPSQVPATLQSQIFDDVSEMDPSMPTCPPSPVDRQTTVLACNIESIVPPTTNAPIVAIEDAIPSSQNAAPSTQAQSAVSLETLTQSELDSKRRRKLPTFLSSDAHTPIRSPVQQRSTASISPLPLDLNVSSLACPTLSPVSHRVRKRTISKLQTQHTQQRTDGAHSSSHSLAIFVPPVPPTVPPSSSQTERDHQSISLSQQHPLGSVNVGASVRKTRSRTRLDSTVPVPGFEADYMTDSQLQEHINRNNNSNNTNNNSNNHPTLNMQDTDAHRLHRVENSLGEAAEEILQAVPATETSSSKWRKKGVRNSSTNQTPRTIRARPSIDSIKTQKLKQNDESANRRNSGSLSANKQSGKKRKSNSLLTPTNTKQSNIVDSSDNMDTSLSDTNATSDSDDSEYSHTAVRQKKKQKGSTKLKHTQSTARKQQSTEHHKQNNIHSKTESSVSQPSSHQKPDINNHSSLKGKRDKLRQTSITDLFSSASQSPNTVRKYNNSLQSNFHSSNKENIHPYAQLNAAWTDSQSFVEDTNQDDCVILHSKHHSSSNHNNNSRNSNSNSNSGDKNSHSAQQPSTPNSQRKTKVVAYRPGSKRLAIRTPLTQCKQNHTNTPKHSRVGKETDMELDFL